MLGGFISTVFLSDDADVAKARLRGAVLVATFAGTILQGSPGWNPGPADPHGTWKESIGYAITWGLVRSGVVSWLTRSDVGHVLSRGMMGEKPSYAVIHAARELPHGRATIVAGVGHLINWEAPGALVDAIRSLDAPVAAK